MITGKVDTRESLNPTARMAQREWQPDEGDGSRECRNCHNFQYMDFSQCKGAGRPDALHQPGRRPTPIDCHKGDCAPTA